jgi:hypothetical protein
MENADRCVKKLNHAATFVAKAVMLVMTARLVQRNAKQNAVIGDVLKSATNPVQFAVIYAFGSVPIKGNAICHVELHVTVSHVT